MRYLSVYFVLFFLLLSVTLPASAATSNAVLKALDGRQWSQAQTLAKHGNDPFLRSLARWYYLLRSDQLPSADMYHRFISNHPHWPELDGLRERMEVSFLSSNPSNAQMISWFAKHPPRTPRGVLMHRMAQGHVPANLLETLWAEADISSDEEQRIMSRYASALSVATHERRTERLVWEKKTSAAQRMLDRISPKKRALYRARMGLKARVAGVDSLVKAVPSSLQRDAGLIYDRMRYRARRRDYAGAEEMLLIAPANVPYAAQWWDVQKRVIRDAIEKKRYKAARQMLDKHSQITPLPRVEAEWLRGWLYYEFLRKPSHAAPAFENIYHTAKMPISRARGAYWAGRAYETAGDHDRSTKWYQVARAFPTTFFGQLAHERLQPGTPLPLPAMAQASTKDASIFARNVPQARAFAAYANSDYGYLIWPYVREYLRNHASIDDITKFAAVAREAKADNVGIKIAKEALVKGAYIAELFPVPPSMPANLAIDPAFALAIARQESRFDRNARSSANARGLMQLLPSTAKLTAREHNIRYDIKKLYQPRYNMILGSHYMHGVLSRFGGAHMLAIAGYNAGPGRSVQWQKRFGRLHPRNYRKNIQWSEMIPFSETRNYVQRVLENYHVYQHMLSKGSAPLNARKILLAGE